MGAQDLHRSPCAADGLAFGACASCSRQRCVVPASQLCRLCTAALREGMGDT